MVFFLFFLHNLILALSLSHANDGRVTGFQFALLGATAGCTGPGESARGLLRERRSNTGHVVCRMTNRTVNRLCICGKQVASLAGLHGTRQFLALAHFHQDKLPAIIQHALDIGRHIDDVFRRDHIIQAVNITVEHLVVPKRISRLFVRGQIIDLGHVANLAFPT
jgi:hypothetical protein